MARHWSKLAAVRGFHRVPDDRAGRRMLECRTCARIIPALGVGYHRGGGVHGGCATRQGGCRCYQELADVDMTVIVWDGSCTQEGHQVTDLLAGPGRRDYMGYRPARPVYGPPVPTQAQLADHQRTLAFEAHALLPVEECDSATTAAGCWMHPAPMAASR